MSLWISLRILHRKLRAPSLRLFSVARVGEHQPPVPHLRRVFVFAPKVGAKLALLILFATFAVAASTTWLEHVPQKDRARPNPLADKSEAIHAGGFLYKQHCAQCHQADAAGDGKKKPSLKTGRIRTATDGDLEWFLRQGDLAHGMPSWSSLPEAQRWQIVAYLRSIQ